MSINRGRDREDVVHIYNGILLSHKNKERNAVCTNMMDLVIIILSEISQTEKDKYHIILLICGICKQLIQLNLFTKQK